MALTATATTKVIDDVKRMLGIRRAVLFKSGFNRENLYYEGRLHLLYIKRSFAFKICMELIFLVRRKPTQDKKVIQDIVEFIKTNHEGESGIVYCFSRKESDEVASALREEGIKAEPYHSQGNSLLYYLVLCALFFWFTKRV